MNCPYCESEMEYGYIRSQEAGIYYLPDPGEPDAIIPTKTSVRKQGGIALDGPSLTRLHKAMIPCWRCKTCKKLIVSYNEDWK